MDLMAPFLHEFTYQAMAHDLLPIQDGEKVTYKVEITTSAVGVSKWADRAGKEGSRILIGKKLIREMQVMRMKRERVGPDIVFVFRSRTRNRY